MHLFERAVLRHYLITFATRRANDWTLSWRTSGLAAFILDHARDLGLAMEDEADGLCITMVHRLRAAAPPPAPSRLERRLRWLCHLLQLAPS